MRKTIGIVNLKGGVGKTTTCVNLGAALAAHGLQVLLVDLDPQKSLTGWSGLESRLAVDDVLTGRAETPQAVAKWEKTGCWILPAGNNLRQIETELFSAERGQYVLRDKLETCDGYDYVLIDSSPSYGLLTINAICASEEVLIPLQTEILALESTVPFFQMLGEIKERFHPTLKIAGILSNMYDSRTNLSKAILEQMRASAHLGPLMFNTIIRKNVKLAETPSLGYAVTRYTTAYGAEDYNSLAAELLDRHNGSRIASQDVVAAEQIAGGEQRQGSAKFNASEDVRRSELSGDTAESDGTASNRT